MKLFKSKRDKHFEQLKEKIRLMNPIPTEEDVKLRKKIASTSDEINNKHIEVMQMEADIVQIFRRMDNHWYWRVYYSVRRFFERIYESIIYNGQ